MKNSQLDSSCYAHKQTARVSTVVKIFSSLSRIKLDNGNVNFFPKGLLSGSSRWNYSFARSLPIACTIGYLWNTVREGAQCAFMALFRVRVE